MKSNFSTGKNKVVFISYANEAMAYSLRRIGRQARRLGLFDEVILYTPKDLPDYVKNTGLLDAPRGGGFMCWKPAILYETLQRQEEGNIVIYVDAGCTLRKSTMWTDYISKMKEYDTLCFQYEDKDYPSWGKWGTTSAKEKYWTKAETLAFMEKYLADPSIGDFPQVLTGVIFAKGKNNSLIRQWRDLIIGHPDLVADPSAQEMAHQFPYYSGHRHDQSVFTPLAALDHRTLRLPETLEYYSPDSFVWASRIRARNWREYVLIQIKHYSRLLFGDAVFEKAKNLFFN